MQIHRISTRTMMSWALAMLIVGEVTAATGPGLIEAPAVATTVPRLAQADTMPARSGSTLVAARTPMQAVVGAPMRVAMPASRGGREVMIYDHGLGMATSKVWIPAGWDFQHDVAFDPRSGTFYRFKMVAVGPRNQYVRSYLGHFLYGNINGVPFEQALQQSVEHVLGVERLQNLWLGRLEPSPRAMSDPELAAMSQRLASRGQRLEIYNAGFAGERGGRRYQGTILFTNMVNPQAGFGLLTPARMVFALAEDFADAHRVADEIDASRVRNPEYGRAMASISERLRQQSDAYARQMMDQSAQAHQRRMADQQAAFASHQRNMAGLNQIQDVAHESYMKTLRSRGSFASVGNEYGSHQALIDQTHERSSFADPWTNSQIALDGQYEYNFTNGLGDYYRTNDPSFDPASLQGDWRSIKPLGP
ncbi:MAG: hypothetical protein R3E83_08025 [Burkholderiaceae bacterium]